MRQMFVQRVKEKEAELKEAEREVQLSHTQICKKSCSYVTRREMFGSSLLYLAAINACLCLIQLQSRFEQLKRLHADEKAALEEKKRVLDEDQSSFSKRRAAAQLLQAQSLTANGKKDKDRKK